MAAYKREQRKQLKVVTSQREPQIQPVCKPHVKSEENSRRLLEERAQVRRQHSKAVMVLTVVQVVAMEAEVARLKHQVCAPYHCQ